MPEHNSNEAEQKFARSAVTPAAWWGYDHRALDWARAWVPRRGPGRADLAAVRPQRAARPAGHRPWHRCRRRPGRPGLRRPGGGRRRAAAAGDGVAPGAGAGWYGGAARAWRPNAVVSVSGAGRRRDASSGGARA